MAKVLIPTPLRQFAEKNDSVQLDGATVAEVMAALTTKFPDLRKQLFNDEGKLRSFVNVYLNDEDIRYLQKDATAVAASDTLSIVKPSQYIAPNVASSEIGTARVGINVTVTRRRNRNTTATTRAPPSAS